MELRIKAEAKLRFSYPAEKPKVLLDGHLAVEGKVLWTVTDGVPDDFLFLAHVHAADEARAVIRLNGTCVGANCELLITAQSIYYYRFMQLCEMIVKFSGQFHCPF